MTFLRSPRPCKVTAKISGRHPAHGVFGPTFSPMLWPLSIYLCKSHSSHERLPLLSHSKGRTTDSESDGVNPSHAGGVAVTTPPRVVSTSHGGTTCYPASGCIPKTVPPGHVLGCWMQTGKASAALRWQQGSGLPNTEKAVPCGATVQTQASK